MNGRWLGWIGVVVLVGSLLGLVPFATRFSWSATGDALASVAPAPLAGAIILALLRHACKGLSWHLLLRPAAPHRLGSALAATYIGSTVGAVSVAIGGDVARLQALTSRDGTPPGRVVASLVQQRAVEALALVVLMAGAGLLPPSSASIPHAGPLACGILGVLALLVWMARRSAWTDRWPAWMRGVVAPFVAPGASRRYAVPLAWSLANWVGGWWCLHLVAMATGADVPVAASLTALLVLNVAGLPRLTPGNVGVTQASLVAVLVAAGADGGAALAAGVVLQAVEVLPLLPLGALLGLGEVVRQVRAARASAAPAP